MIRERTFAEALEHRRSYYSISNDSPVLDEEIVHIIRTVGAVIILSVTTLQFWTRKLYISSVQSAQLLFYQ